MQESFLPYVSTAFSPKSWGSRRHRTEHSLKATALGKEESCYCDWACAHGLPTSLPSSGCLQAMGGTGGDLHTVGRGSVLGAVVLEQHMLGTQGRESP